MPASERALREAPRPQKITGIIQTANLVRTNALVASSLGRNLSSCPAEGACSATVTVPLVPSGETTSVTVSGALLDQRLNQTDLPLTKIFRYSRGRIQGMLDLYNAFNNRAPHTINSAYGPTWLTPTRLLGGWILKFGAQVDCWSRTTAATWRGRYKAVWPNTVPAAAPCESAKRFRQFGVILRSSYGRKGMSWAVTTA